MRPPSSFPALFSFSLALALAVPASAQVKADLGASVSAGSGVSAVSGSASLNNAALPAPALNAALSPSLLSAGPALNLAPAARPESVALPASALSAVPAAAASIGDPNRTPKAAEAQTAAAPAPPGPPGPPAAAASAPPGSPPVPFIVALQKLGVSQELTTRLLAFLATRHPGDQDAVYHGQGHSFEVAGYAARVVENANIPDARKILLIFAASLHDVDPERTADTPARVSATLTHLDNDPEARALLADFGSRFGFNAAQVKALIMGTDFSMDPADMKARQDAFVAAAKEAFPGENFGLEWGKRLAFVDQSSTYLGSVELARKRVEGLAHEIRSNLKALGKDGGPTDEQMLAGTGKFLAVLRANPEFDALPNDLKRQFLVVQAHFAARQTPEAWANEAAPVPARAPPELAAARAYIRGIAAGIPLNERQTDALLEQFFEENGIRPGSPRADAVRAAMLPSRVAAEDRAVQGLSPLLRSHRAVLLKLAADRKTTPKAIEAILQRRGVLEAFAGLGDAAFLNQAERTLNRDELETAVARYRDNAQGRFLTGVAGNMATPSGKSVEEVARDGVFAYVDYYGSKIRNATSGRDPDVRSVDALLYVTRVDGRWRFGGYRQNRPAGRKDTELVKALKDWLIAGGIPEKDLE